METKQKLPLKQVQMVSNVLPISFVPPFVLLNPWFIHLTSIYCPFNAFYISLRICKLHNLLQGASFFFNAFKEKVVI